MKSPPWILGVGLPMLTLAHARGEDQAAYRHETYVEGNGRMRVDTESAQVRKTLTPWLDIRLGIVYDAISGATPLGTPPADQIVLHPLGNPAVTIPSSAIKAFRRAVPVDAVSGASPSTIPITSRTTVTTAHSSDYRTAVEAAATLTLDQQHFTPLFHYSEESDYVSYTGALTYSLDLSKKNTTLNLGFSYSADEVIANSFMFLSQNRQKNNSEFLLGVSQLLGPKTIASANLTLGHAQGYLDDPYRAVVFENTLLSPSGELQIYGEKRPTTRDSQAIVLSITHALTDLNASVEGSYRYYHDSWNIQAHTATIAWFQKFGPKVVVSPSFRYYRQTAASFYGTEFPGDPVGDPANVPAYYSSDYRLSSMETFNVGIQATITLRDSMWIDLGYQRYMMHGLDGITSQSAYPDANVFTFGLRVWF